MGLKENGEINENWRSTENHCRNHPNSTLTSVKKSDRGSQDALLFAYTLRREDNFYPVHTFVNNSGQGNVLNLSNNRLSPLPESCSSSVVGLELGDHRVVDLIYDGDLTEDLGIWMNDYDMDAWKRVMEPLEILEFVFSNGKREWTQNYQRQLDRNHHDKYYATRIPAELVSSAVLNYCSRQLSKVIPSAFSELKHLTTLQLCCNALTELPEEIGLLRRLQILSLSNNQLKSIPSTIGYLINLESLYLDRNKLTSLPRSISGLTKLKILSIAANEFQEIPRSLMLLTRLVTFECDRNPLIKAVPSEITRFSQLARFHVEECPGLLKESQYHKYSKENSTKGPVSLLESSARALIRHKCPVLYSIPRHLKLFLSKAEECSFCSGPMIESRVIHCRTIKRIDRPFPIIEHLCCSHWQNEEDRLKMIFSPSPKSTPPALLCTDRRNRSGPLAPFNQFDPIRLARGERIMKKFSTDQQTQTLVPLALIVDWPAYPILQQ